MPIGLTTAAVVTAGVGAAAGIGSAIIGANAAEDAAAAQAEAARAGMDAATRSRLEMFEKAKGYLDPYASLGTETLPTLKSFLGLGPEGSAGITKALEATPGYQFSVDQGQKAIGNQQQMAGARYSGNALKAASEFSRQMGYSAYSDMFNKLMGVTGMGQAAAGGIANAATGVGEGNAQTYQQGYSNIGNANASGIMGQANAWSSGITGVADALTGGINVLATPFSGGGGWSGAAIGQTAPSGAPMTRYR